MQHWEPDGSHIFCCFLFTFDSRKRDKKQKMNCGSTSASKLHNPGHSNLNVILTVCWKSWPMKMDQKAWHIYGVLWDWLVRRMQIIVGSIWSSSILKERFSCSLILKWKEPCEPGISVVLPAKERIALKLIKLFCLNTITVCKYSNTKDRKWHFNFIAVNCWSPIDFNRAGTSSTDSQARKMPFWCC